ncbi:MAG TPA: DegV family protein [Pseudogracilibacillus sp.]|nr:DegV family protein [Pseudogracilibacillus sp.]
MKIAVVTDSTSYIPQEVIDKLNIHVIPLSVNFGEETYAENIEISTDKFYEKLQEEKALPTTSQPAIGAFIELYEKLEQSYDAVISIHISKKLSGTFETAKSAGNMMEKLQVHAYDTEYSAMPQGFYVIRAAELANEGQDIASIIQALNELRKNIRAYFMVDDLIHLQRGGRLSGAQALLGSLLNIKPILHIVEGSIVPYEKVRTKKRALRRIVKMLEDDVQTKRVQRVVFIHGNNEKEALKLRDDFQAKYPNIETMISYFGPVVGTHLGEGSLGITWYKQ